MPNGFDQPIPFTLTGDVLQRAHQAIALARQQLRDAQQVLEGRHLPDGLVETEETLGGVAIDLRQAVEADKDDAEASGETERQRQTWYPVYRAAAA